MHDMTIPNRKTRRKRFIFIVAAIVLFVVAKATFWKQPASFLSPLPDTTETAETKLSQPLSLNIFARKKTADDLMQVINNIIGTQWNDFSIVVEDYTSDFALRYSEGEIFVAASVNKIPILAALYQLVKSGEIDLDRDITLQANDIQDYGTGSIRYDPPGTVYSVKTLARLMIKQSDNTAAYILANHIIGYPRLKEIVSNWGLTQTDMVINKTSNQDIAKIFRMIYEEKIADTAHTQEMLSFMKDTDFETRIPKELPDTATAYHKIGTEVGIFHDAGIITDGTTTYYIGIFTNGETQNEQTEALMAKVSRAIYDYMKS